MEENNGLEFLSAFLLRFRGGGTRGAGDAKAPLIFLKIGRILVFGTPNIYISNRGASPKNLLAPPIFHTFCHP